MAISISPKCFLFHKNFESHYNGDIDMMGGKYKCKESTERLAYTKLYTVFVLISAQCS